MEGGILNKRGVLFLTVAQRHGKGAAAFSTLKPTKVAALANPELGAKQICPTCSTKFYDLGRRPAACPKCGAEFDPEEALRNRRVRARAIVPEDDAEEEKPVVAADTEDGFEAEPDEAPELDAPVDDPPLTSDDDVDPATPAASDNLGVDFSEDDEPAAEDEDDATFIEDEDDDFPDDELSGLPGEDGPEDH